MPTVPPQNQRIVQKQGFSYGWFFDPVYEVPVHFLWGITLEQLNSWVQRTFKTDFEGRDDVVGKCLMLKEPSGAMSVVVMIRRGVRGTTLTQAIAHECLHATRYILDSTGMRMNDTNDEAYCYFLDSLVKRFVDMMKQPKRFDKPKRKRRRKKR